MRDAARLTRGVRRAEINEPLNGLAIVPARADGEGEISCAVARLPAVGPRARYAVKFALATFFQPFQLFGETHLLPGTHGVCLG
jgi:hypothetical protein